MRLYLVRVGSFGMVGRFRAEEQLAYARGSRVLCRTPRGLEVGEVLTQVEECDGRAELDGALVREVDQQDELRLTSHAQRRDRAVETCQGLLDRSGTPAVVVDVDYPLDGQAMCFYVLGELGEALDTATCELARQFHVSVTFQPVAEEPAGGCGAGCCAATSSCGSNGGCATCPALDACRRGAN
jgi:hypothetical protein